jgi:hypothetical protein
MSVQLMKEGKGKPYLFVLFNDALVWVSVTSFAYKDQVLGGRPATRP